LSPQHADAAALEATAKRFSQALAAERDPVARARLLSSWGEA
jgi:hypothetical protein